MSGRHICRRGHAVVIEEKKADFVQERSAASGSCAWSLHGITSVHCSVARHSKGCNVRMSCGRRTGRHTEKGRVELRFGILIHGCRHGIRHVSWSGEPNVGVCATGRCTLLLAGFRCPRHLAIRVCHSRGACVRLWYFAFWSSDRAAPPWPSPMIYGREYTQREAPATTVVPGSHWFLLCCKCRLPPARLARSYQAASDVLVAIYCVTPSLPMRFRYAPTQHVED